jgi:hypothetical protein
MSYYNNLLEQVQELIEAGYGVLEIAEIMAIDYETAESVVEYWTDYAE